MFYVYFLKFHMNGRLLDVYQRLNCNNSDFFVPYDMEISNKVKLVSLILKAHFALSPYVGTGQCDQEG